MANALVESTRVETTHKSNKITQMSREEAIQELVLIVQSNMEQMSLSGHNKPIAGGGSGGNVDSASDISTTDDESEWEKRDNHNTGSVLNTRKTNSRGTLLVWETREIPDGFEHLYGEKANAAKGFIQHRWPHVLIGRTQVEMNRIIPRIPNFDFEDMKIHKAITKICSTRDFVSKGNAIFNGEGVFDWVRNILRVMENENIHPNVLACAIWKGEFMTAERRVELEDERMNCVLGTATDSVAFRKISDRNEVEKSVLWLEALLIWIMERYGRSEILLDAQEEISKLRLKTRSLVGVWKLHIKIRQLQKQLPSDQRSYAVYDKHFYNALEKNPHVDPISLVHAYNTQKLIAELSLQKSYKETEFARLREEEKFEHIKAIVRNIHERALNQREDAREYTVAGKPMDSTEEEAQRVFARRKSLLFERREEEFG